MSDSKTNSRARIDNDRLIGEVEKFTSQTQIIGVAAKGLARPLMDQQTNARSFEVLRAEARFGKSSDAARLRRVQYDQTVEQRAQFEQQFNADLSTAPQPDDKQGGYYGTVTRSGVAQPELLVGVVDADGAWAGFACTDSNGAYSFTVPLGVEGYLRVQEKEGAPLYQEADSLRSLSSGQVVRRDIELDAATICPAPGPATGGGDGGTGVQTVDVPNIVGLSEDEAVNVLRKNMLNRGARTTEPRDEGAGTVVSQDPEAGTAVEPGANISIVVATAAQQLMPRVTEMPISLARATLSRVGITSIEEVPKEAPDAVGLVLDQDPAEGTAVNSDTNVNLTVGIDNSLIMPRLIGQKVTAARQTLNEMGIDNIIFEERASSDGAGLVLDQSPGAQSEIDTSTEVTLVIGVSAGASGDTTRVIEVMARNDRMVRRRLSSDQLAQMMERSGASSTDDLRELSALSVNEFNEKLGLNNRAMATDMRIALRQALDES